MEHLTNNKQENKTMGIIIIKPQLGKETAERGKRLTRPVNTSLEK